MKRIAASLLAILLVIVPLSVRPLGLGEIELRSHLNAPLDARVNLHSVGAGDLEGMRVSLGSPEQFRRAGIDFAFVLSKLRFTPKVQGNKAYIHITSQAAIAEPFLNFLLEVDWQNGRTVREYTLLLDPPVYGAAISSRVKDTVPTVTAPPAMGPSSTQAASAPPRPAVARRPGLTPGGTYGPVTSTDTLWSLADRFRGDGGVSIQQMMLAMLRLNPEAFSESNVNMLREGAVLRIPTAAEAEESSRAAALGEVQRQHAAWEDIRQTLGTRVAKAPDGASAGASAARPPAALPAAPSGPGAAPATPGGADARLKLMSGGAASGGVGSTTGESAEISTLREELERAREAADASRRESEELSSRLEEAEALVNELERLVQVRSSELEALQQKLNESERALRDSQPAPSVPAPSTPMTTETPSVTPAPSTPPAVPLPSPAASQPSGFLDLVRSQLDFLPVDPILFLGAILVILVLAVVGVVFAKRRGSDADGSAEPQAMRAAAVPAAAAGAAAAGSAAAVAASAPSIPADADVTQILDLDDEPEPPEDVDADAVTQVPTQRVAPRMQPEEDPLAEVNVYLAYERFDQAETLVKDAIESHPERHEYKLKLLEIYHAAKNVPAFETAAASLQESVGEDAEPMVTARQWWDEISPGRALFVGGALSSDAGEDEIFDVTGPASGADIPPQAGETTTQLSDGVDTTQGVDFDLGLEFDSDGDETGEGTNVDFDLGLEEPTQPPAGAADTGFGFDAEESTPAGADTETDLDFDLEGFDTEVEPAPETPPAGSDTDIGLDFDDAADGLGETTAEVTGATDDTDIDFVLESAGDGTEGSAGEDTGLDFDLGDFAATTTEAPVRGEGRVPEPESDLEAEPESPPSGSDTDFDIDLDLDSLADTTELPSMDAEPEAGFDLEIPGSGSPEPEETGLDLDLDLGDDLEDKAAEELSTVELRAPPEGADELDLDLALDLPEEDPDTTPLVARAGAADEDSFLLQLREEDGSQFPTIDGDAASGPAEGEADALSIDEDFAGLFDDEDDGAGGQDTDGTLSGDLTELELDTDHSKPASADGGELDLDLNALLDEGSDDDAFEGVFDGAGAERPAADRDDEEVTDLNLGSDLATVQSEETSVLDFDLGELDDPASEGGDTGVDFDLDGLEFEPTDDTVEPEDESGENRTLTLGRGPGGDADEIQTKLDLAQAYIDMGDSDGAKGILGEVMAEGNPEQRGTAENLLKSMQ